MKAKACVVLIMLSLLAVAMAAAAVTGDANRFPTDGEAEAARRPRPWDCCDNEMCDKKAIPDCQCRDKVKSCSSNCNRCEPVVGERLYVCRDIYTYEAGEPFAPMCNPSASAGS